MKRREFISALGGASAFAFLPAFTRAAFADAATLDELTISDVEILKLSGTHELVPGLNRQYQVNPLHLYAERRPKPFKDPPASAKPERRPLTHYYLRIRTKGGVEGIYGAVDKEALPVLLGTLRPLVIGQNALAVERIWDQMYRSNRHSRASHFMMAISYIDNALWDLRGRHFGAPVFRLLGGPTQLPVRVYGSCLGFSIDPPLAGKRAAQLKKDGFIHQKWFLGYGPGDGARGMDLNVQLVKALREAVGETCRSCSTPTRAGTCSTPSSGAARSSSTGPTSSKKRCRCRTSRVSSGCRRPPRFRLPPASTCTAAGKPSSSSRRTRCSSSRRIPSGAAASAKP